MITQAGRRPSAASRSIRRSIALGVVERHGDGQVDDGLRDPGAVRQRGEVVPVADLVVLDADRDHHRVVVAVVGAEDLHDRLAAGQPARDADRVHRRLRAGVRVPPLRQAEAPGQLLGDGDPVLGRRREVRAERGPLADGRGRPPGARAPASSSRSRCGSRRTRCRRRPRRARPRRARGRSATGRAAGTTRRRRRRACCRARSHIARDAPVRSFSARPHARSAPGRGSG